MGYIWERIKGEPVMAAAAIQAFLNLLVAFFVPLTEVQIASIMAFVNILIMLFVRQMVVPAVTAQRIKDKNELLEQLVDDRFPNPRGGGA